MNIKGIASIRKVFIDGVELSPKESQKIWNNSPDGFCWGYNGSGPAKLALAILLKVSPSENQRRTAKILHQKFKELFIAPLPIDDDFEIDVNVEEWIKHNEPKQR